MVENKYEMQDLVSATLNQKPIDFSNAFGSLMVDRLNDAVAEKKMEIAKAMFSPAVETDESENDEDLENNSEEETDGETA
jgi:hypothetical protein